MCWHTFGKWEDVDVRDVGKGVGLSGLPYVIVKQVIKQQRRCSKCNLVRTRTS